MPLLISPIVRFRSPQPQLAGRQAGRQADRRASGQLASICLPILHALHLIMFPVASFIHFVVHGPFSRRFCSRRVRCLPCECNPRYSSRRCFRRCPCHGNHCHCSCLLGEDVAAVLPKRRRRRRRQQRTLSLVRSSFVFSRLLILTLFLRCFSASLFASAPASTLLLASCLYWLARKQSFISFVQVELRASPSSPRSLLLSASDDGGSTDGGCNDGSVFFSTSPWPVAIPSSPPPPDCLLPPLPFSSVSSSPPLVISEGVCWETGRQRSSGNEAHSSEKESRNRTCCTYVHRWAYCRAHFAPRTAAISQALLCRNWTKTAVAAVSMMS